MTKVEVIIVIIKVIKKVKNIYISTMDFFIIFFPLHSRPRAKKVVIRKTGLWEYFGRLFGMRTRVHEGLWKSDGSHDENIMRSVSCFVLCPYQMLNHFELLLLLFLFFKKQRKQTFYYVCIKNINNLTSALI